jgi:hypothetical protein
MKLTPERESKIRECVELATGYSLDDLRICLSEIDRLREHAVSYLMNAKLRRAHIERLEKERDQLKEKLEIACETLDFIGRYNPNGEDVCATAESCIYRARMALGKLFWVKK